MLSGQDTRAHKAAAAVGRSPILEVQIVDLADSITYDAHDVDDALQMGLLDIDTLNRQRLVARALKSVKNRQGGLPANRQRQSLVHELIELQVSDLLGQATEQLRLVDGQTSEDLRSAGYDWGILKRLRPNGQSWKNFCFNPFIVIQSWSWCDSQPVSD